MRTDLFGLRGADPLMGVALMAFIFFLCVSTSRPSMGQETTGPETLALVDRYVKVVQFEEHIRIQMREVAKEMMRFYQDDIPNADARTKEELSEESYARLLRLHENDVRLYSELVARHFTKDEIRALLEFYETPHGKSSLKKFRAFDEEMAKLFIPSSSQAMWSVWEEAKQAVIKKGRKL